MTEEALSAADRTGLDKERAIWRCSNPDCDKVQELDEYSIA
jgi:hypothetical protein